MKKTEIITNLESFIKKIPGLDPVARSSLKLSRSMIGEIRGVYQWRRLAKNREIKLELGSGPKRGENGFTTVDLRGADIYRDLRNGIPLGDNTVSAIYTSHMLEHIPFPQLILFLTECRRVLKPGAYMSVCVPNARNYIEAYVAERSFQDSESLWQTAIADTGSWIDQVNYIAYMAGNHCYLFDEENLVKILRKAGFASAALRTFDQSIDLERRKHESIYAIATK